MSELKPDNIEVLGSDGKTYLLEELRNGDGQAKMSIAPGEPQGPADLAAGKKRWWVIDEEGEKLFQLPMMEVTEASELATVIAPSFAANGEQMFKLGQKAGADDEQAKFRHVFGVLMYPMTEAVAKVAEEIRLGRPGL